MKKIAMAVLAMVGWVFCFGLAQAANKEVKASRPATSEEAYVNACGQNPVPVKIAEGVWFVAEQTVLASGGSMSEPIFWKGVNSNWKRVDAEVTTVNGVRGVKVSGTGEDSDRWNLWQAGKGVGRKGWLRIENAHQNYDSKNCKSIHVEGKTLANGDPADDTDGPAYAVCR